MKNKFSMIGIIALVAIIGFSMLACGGGGGDLGDEINVNGSVFFVSGTFSKGGGNNVAFKLADAAPSDRSARAVDSDTYAVTGVLKDGDFTIQLSGTYDPTAQMYSASASANSLGIRYSVNGAYDSDGNSVGSTATLAVKDWTTGEWATTTYVVNETAAVKITGTAVDSETGGIPEFARGNWYYNYTDTEKDYAISMKFLANQWNVNVDIATTDSGQTSYKSYMATVMEVEDKGDGKYDVFFAYPFYEPKNEDQVAAAVDNFFTGKGVTPTRVTDLESPMPEGPWYYIYGADYWSSIWWGNFSESQSILVNQYYSTSALEKYLISQKVAPTTIFEQDLFQFSSNNTELTRIVYGNGSVVTYYLWVLKDPEYALTLDGTEDEQTLTRNP